MSTAIGVIETRTTAEVVAGNIRAEAARRGMTQVALARALGMSQSAVTTRWRGVARWQLDELDAVADILGVSVQDLVTDFTESRTPTGGSHRGGLPRARRDSNPQPSDWYPLAPVATVTDLDEYRLRRAS